MNASTSSIRPWLPSLLAVLAAPLLGVSACPSPCADDADGDGVCDADDVCPDGDDGLDIDGDGIPDDCDDCPLDPVGDADGDGLCDLGLVPVADGLPLDFAVLQRDGSDQCEVTVTGLAEASVTSVVLAVTEDDGSGFGSAAPVSADGQFTVTVMLPAGLHDHHLELSASSGTETWRVATRDDVACGDLLFINGQSNAVAGDYHAEGLSNQSQSPFIRTFGSASLDPATVAADLVWDRADGAVIHAHAMVGAWGLRMAELLMQAESMPIGLLNGAVGGTLISQHQRNDANPEDLNTIYGRMLFRARASDMASSARAMIWYQGESDGTGSGAAYLNNFDALRADWYRDFPALERIYVFQVRAGCGIDLPFDGALQLDYYDAAGALLERQSRGVLARQGWARHTVASTAPAGASLLNFIVWPTLGGVASFDDNSLLAVAGGAERLTNGGLEAGTTFPTGWAAYGTGTYDWRVGGAHTGTRSMALNNGANYAVLYQSLAVTGGEQFSASTWSRSDQTQPWTDIREALRTLPSLYPDVSVMTTGGAPGHDGCHFYYAGYRELGERIYRLVARDLFGGDPTGAAAPRVVSAQRLSSTQVKLNLAPGSGTLTVEPGAEAWFYIEGADVVAAAAGPDTLTLTLGAATNAGTISFADHPYDAADVLSASGVGLEVFWNLAIQ